MVSDFASENKDFNYWTALNVDEHIESDSREDIEDSVETPCTASRPRTGIEINGRYLNCTGFRTGLFHGKSWF